jgi:two-component system cell cycle response regulator
VKVLIAEDDNMSRLIVEAAVAQLQYEYCSASDGLEAWKLFEMGGIDVVISDRSMPGIDGLELCRRVRAQPGDKYTYFIFVTSSGDSRGIADGNFAGADDYLVKPLDPDRLANRLVVAGRITGLYRRLAEQQSQLAILNRQLFEQARLDSLTRLGNRLSLREDLESLSISDGGKAATTICCALMCDVDLFKNYNDTYGHFEGDRVLEGIANILMREVGRGGRGYRFGGEEFLLILKDVTLAQAIALAERVRVSIERLRVPHRSAASGVVTVSIGVSQWDQKRQTVSEWLKETDEALYQAKALGRNQAYPQG